MTARTSGAAIPVIRVARTVASRPGSGGARTRVAPRHGAGHRRGVDGSGLERRHDRAGWCDDPADNWRPAHVGLGRRRSLVSSSPSPSPNPSPAPSPRPTPVDTAVKAVTSVTSQVPAPVGPAITQTVQSAGTAADTLLSKLP